MASQRIVRNALFGEAGGMGPGSAWCRFRSWLRLPAEEAHSAGDQIVVEAVPVPG
jgi:hypothetical protein